MRVRTITILSIIAVVFIGGGWALNNAQNTFAVGEGGLPLIKANPNPIKLPPEDPGGETIANADSTVFAVIAGSDEDPSMQDLRMPEGETIEDSTEFAGLKTGFTVPSEPEDKVESMFTGEEIIPSDETQAGRYLTGSVAPPEMKETMENAATAEPEIVAEVAPPMEEAVVAEPEPIQVAIPTTGKDMPITPAEPIVSVDTDPMATVQALEAMEKTMMTAPPLKPEAVVEVEKVEEKVEKIIAVTPSAKPTVKEERKTEPAHQVVQKIEKALEPVYQAPAPAGYYIQMSSTPSQAEAETAWARGKRMHPEILSNLTPRFQPVTIPGKGNYVRVQAGPLPLEEAKERCQAVRLANPRGGCLVVRK